MYLHKCLAATAMATARCLFLKSISRRLTYSRSSHRRPRASARPRPGDSRNRRLARGAAAGAAIAREDGVSRRARGRRGVTAGSSLSLASRGPTAPLHNRTYASHLTRAAGCSTQATIQHSLLCHRSHHHSIIVIPAHPFEGFVPDGIPAHMPPCRPLIIISQRDVSDQESVCPCCCHRIGQR